MTGRVLAPNEALEVLDARLPRMSRCYGALVIHDAEGRATDRGTVSFCEVQGRRLLLTANHVAVAHEGHDTTLLHYELDPENSPILETLSHGRRAAFRPKVVYRDAVLDVAALAVPDQVSGIAGITWMDLDDGVRATRRAAAWFAESSPDQTLATTAFGFGNYGALGSRAT